MRLTKRQLKRIIREEYTRLKRRGLIREHVGDEHHDHPHADVPLSPGGGYDSAKANKLAEELMEAFPHGCSWEDGEEYALMSGYTEDDYAYAIDIIAQMTQGY